MGPWAIDFLAKTVMFCTDNIFLTNVVDSNKKKK